MNTVKVSTVIGTSMNSFGDKLTAFYGTDGKVYYTSMMEGYHSEVKPGNTVMGCDQVMPNEQGLIDLTFIFNSR